METLPNNLIEHWSYSSMSLFLRNPLSFKKKYILKIYDDLMTPSGVVGQAGHKALEAFYNGVSVDRSIEIGLEHINKTPDTGIDYGKTGSRAQIIKDYSQAINFYISEAPEFKEVLGVEKGITKNIHYLDTGEELAIPAKSFSDLIVKNDKGEIEVWDHKFVKAYSDGEISKATFIIQAMFNFHTVREEYGIDPKRMVFNECKISKNKDGGPQLQPYTIEFADYPQYFQLFYNLYNDCTRAINRPDAMFLPNFQDNFDGQNSFDTYMANVITVDAPVTVQHKTKQTEIVEKKYIQSTVDKVENKNLTPEEKIRTKLQEFGLAVEMQNTFTGPNIVLYTFKPSRGLKMSQFEKHDKDLAIALKAKTIRIQAPIMGTDLVGVEVPRHDSGGIVALAEPFKETLGLEENTLQVPIGVNVYGETIIKDLSDMPHLLIAGATGSGKSVMMNVIIKSLIENNDPERLNLVLIDPKRVELSQYKNLPHLLAPVIYEDKKAANALNWLVGEMESRYTMLEDAGYKNIDEYNTDMATKMPKIVVVIDEFADLILQSDIGEIEKSIIRLAQKARAVGIHIILGTQRPSVDVVTGLIKANIPTRIAFMTSSSTDSRVILDENGAEELIGKGDMLFLDPSVRGLQRLQGFYV